MRKLAIVVALSSTVLATPALARDGAWYVGGDFGAMIVEDVEFDVGTTEDAIIVDHEYGFDGAAFVGYDLGSFRLEAEVAYKRARIDELETVIGLPGAVGQGRTVATTFANAGGGNTTALSFMVNGLLDFGDDEGISGLIGGRGGGRTPPRRRLRGEGPARLPRGGGPRGLRGGGGGFGPRKLQNPPPFPHP